MKQKRCVCQSSVRKIKTKSEKKTFRWYKKMGTRMNHIMNTVIQKEPRIFNLNATFRSGSTYVKKRNVSQTESVLPKQITIQTKRRNVEFRILRSYWRRTNRSVMVSLHQEELMISSSKITILISVLVQAKFARNGRKKK